MSELKFARWRSGKLLQVFRPGKPHMTVLNMGGLSSSLTQSHRPIRLRLWYQNKVLDDVLLAKHVQGQETLCGGIEYRLHCVSLQTGLPLKEFMALPVELQFVTDRRQLRSVCGIVSQASAGESDGGLATGFVEQIKRRPS